MKKNLLIFLFILYYILLTVTIVFKFGYIQHTRYIILTPYQYMRQKPFIGTLETLFNIIAFIPLGMFLKGLKTKIWLSVLVIVLTTIIFEVIQLKFEIGTFDVTDIINNTLGGLIGLILIKRK